MSKTFKYTIVLWFLFINVSFANVIDVDNTQLKKLIKEDVFTGIPSFRRILLIYSPIVNNSLVFSIFNWN